MKKKYELVTNVKNILDGEKSEIKPIVEEWLLTMLSQEHLPNIYQILLDDYYKARREKNTLLWHIRESKAAAEFAEKGYENAKKIYADILRDKERFIAAHEELKSKLALAKTKTAVSQQMNQSRMLLELLLNPGKRPCIPEDWEEKVNDKLENVEKELMLLVDDQEEAYLKVSEIQSSIRSLLKTASTAKAAIPAIDHKINVITKMMTLITEENKPYEVYPAAAVVYQVMNALNLIASVSEEKSLTQMVQATQNNSELKHFFHTLVDFVNHYQDKMKRLGYLVPPDTHMESERLLSTLKEQLLNLFLNPKNYASFFSDLSSTIDRFKTDAITTLHQRKFFLFDQCCRRKSTRSYLLAEGMAIALENCMTQKSDQKEETECSLLENDIIPVFFLKKQPEDRINETFPILC